MKVVEHTGGARERCILIGMIVNPLVLGRIAVKWDGNLFASPWANLIAAWCVKHHKQYGKAPLKAIEGYFTEWQEDNQDSDTVQLVEKFLGTLSDEYAQADEINPDHLLDVAGRYFKKVRLASMFAQGQNELEIGHIDKAEKRVVSYAQIELGAGAGIDLFRDREAVASTFDARREPLIEYPDGLGVFFGSALSRDSFVAFLGPEKSTKSFWQLDVAYRALLQRRKVALFEVGDMSESQVKLRFLTRVAGEPHTSPDGKWPHAVKCPSAVRLPRPGEEHAHVDFKERVFDGPLDAQRAWQACEDLMQNKVRSKKCYFRISVHANSSINVLGIRSVLEGWEADGWTPDVCIASGQKVLTDHGLISIEKVRRSDRLWDGTGWVSHDGLVFKGVKRVITYAGLTATPDHLVYTQDGWRTLESCRRLRLCLPTTGSAERAVRLGRGNFVGCEGAEGQGEEWKGDEEEVRLRSLRQVWQGEVVSVVQPPQWYRGGMPALFAAETVPNVAVPETRSCEATLHQRESQGVEVLRWQRDRIQVQGHIHRLFVGGEGVGHSGEKVGVGQDRERRALRAWESSVVNTPAELCAHKSARGHSQDAQVSYAVPTHSVRGRCADSLLLQGDDSGTDHQPVGGEQEEVRESPVWDLLNAGPLHRFTVQGVLAHNCIVDYADILAPPSGRMEVRDQINTTWKQLRALSQELHCLVVTATQADAESYDRKTLTRRNFSEDKRKLAHVTGLVGINVTAEEKELGLCRLNWIVLRESAYTSRRCCHVAGCLPLANPAVKSVY